MVRLRSCMHQQVCALRAAFYNERQKQAPRSVSVNGPQREFAHALRRAARIYRVKRRRMTAYICSSVLIEKGRFV
jgi:hypothetical protein